MPPTVLDSPCTAEATAAEWLLCSCCGHMLRDTAAENCSHGAVPYPFDQGYGMCRRCGGDPTGPTEADRMGWAARAFFETRIALLAQQLSPTNRDKLHAMSYTRQVAVVTRLVQNGSLI